MTRRSVCSAVVFVLLVALFALTAPPALSQGGRDEPSPIVLDKKMTTADGFNVRYNATWSEGPVRYGQIYELVRAPADTVGKPATLQAPRIRVSHETRRSHAEAIRRLHEIDAEQDEPSTFLAIGGWPALQRQYRTPMERPGPPRDDGEYLSSRVTTVIAVGPTLVRIEGVLWPGSSPDLVDELKAIALSATFSSRGKASEVEATIEELRGRPRLHHRPPTPAAPPGPQGTTGRGGPSGVSDLARSAPGGNASPVTPSTEEVSVGEAQRLQTGGTDSEIEIAVSTDGMNVVVVNNGRDYATSNDGGLTFPTTGTVPGVPGGGANGDPSIAYGASGNFYFGFIGYPPLPPGPPPPVGARACSTGIASSTDNGANFNFVANATLCDDVNGPTCFPDQEHIAADRFNLSGSNQDQVYSTWRNFSGGGCNGTGFGAAGPVIPSIVCSTDGGATWPTLRVVGGGGDYPRITVGQDGFVYVVSRNGNNLMLDKFSSCANGLVQQAGFPATIAAGISRVDCTTGIAGIDRCNNGSDFTSQTVAVDDTDPDHIFAAYAVSTAAGVNESVFVQDSTDGGATWPAGRIVQLNSGVNGRRFMPWVCSLGGAACVTWYDTRAATAGQNDLADFYGGSASVVAGTLTAGPEFRISDVSDPMCASGWGGAPRAVSGSELCSTQPQRAGSCVNLAGNSTGVRCDFSNCGTNNCGAPAGVGAACECNTAAGETCQCGGGIPKYGDYNGNACAAGGFYTAWASATSPPGIAPASTGIDLFFSLQKLDTDGDGIWDANDTDDDNDGVLDAADPAPRDPDVCGDSDSDTCDDCSVGTDDFGPLSDQTPLNDGTDTDGDGSCNAGDPDDDNDGVDDGPDPSPLNPDICGDTDSDLCDDCTIGTDDFGPLSDQTPLNDGLDTDSDGLCNVGDPDDDNDGVEDGPDPEPLNPYVCGLDDDGDICDDCTGGGDVFGPLPNNDINDDGADDDADGICNDGDQLFFSTAATQYIAGFGNALLNHVFNAPPNGAALIDVTDHFLPWTTNLDALDVLEGGVPLVGGDVLFSVNKTTVVSHVGGLITLQGNNVYRLSAGTITTELDMAALGLGQLATLNAIDQLGDGSYALSTSASHFVTHAGGTSYVRPWQIWHLDPGTSTLTLMLDTIALYGFTDVDAVDVLKDGRIAYSIATNKFVAGTGLVKNQDALLYDPGDGSQIITYLGSDAGITTEDGLTLILGE